MKFTGAHGLTLATLVSLCLSAAAQAKPTNFIVDDPNKRDVVSFNSDAPIEVIVGHTSGIKGKINLDDSLDLTKKPLEAEFTVDLTSIDTGIALRNEHMRDNFLQTSKFPQALFKVTSISSSPPTLVDGKTAKVKAMGEFTLHGKTVKREIPVDVTFRKVCADQGKFDKCDLIMIKSTFPVPFKDYDIQRPEILFKKLADTVFVTVAATAYRAPGEGASSKTAAPATKTSTPAAKPSAAKPAATKPAAKSAK